MDSRLNRLRKIYEQPRSFLAYAARECPSASRWLRNHCFHGCGRSSALVALLCVLHVGDADIRRCLVDTSLKFLGVGHASLLRRRRLVWGTLGWM